ncbi:hypothetical protein ZHAS_00012271 [Anopheles sinensis]|uniref:Uncharacterized protein n=1 Tax=Anopheles sinensis TaxID=74873 RepID=A0A084W290_ANOSI|nr:hypothetical protein ZHAS_00012271 [Anopheles sinensis]
MRCCSRDVSVSAASVSASTHVIPPRTGPDGTHSIRGLLRSAERKSGRCRFGTTGARRKGKEVSPSSRVEMIDSKARRDKCDTLEAQLPRFGGPSQPEVVRGKGCWECHTEQFTVHQRSPIIALAMCNSPSGKDQAAANQKVGTKMSRSPDLANWAGKPSRGSNRPPIG